MKYVRPVLAALLIPLALALVWNFYCQVVDMGRSVTVSALPFWLGLGSYFIFQIVFFRPIKTYVFGHELTHALVGILSGARLKSFKVSSSGGSVVLTKTNVWITLAPYFIPLYTMLLIGVYWPCSRFWHLEAYYPYFLFAAGFSLSFHFSLTHYALAQGQSDLKQFGKFFSMVFIILVSVLVLTVLLKLLFPQEIQLLAFFKQSGLTTVAIWRALFVEVKKLWLFFRSMK